MQLISVILLFIAIWVLYKIYISYTDIVKELKQIKQKCVKEGTSDNLTNHVSDNYTSDNVNNIRNSVLSTLKDAVARL